MTALLSVKDLQRHFSVEGNKEWLSGKKILRAVDGVTLSVQRGQTLGIVGESGCGKSTMAKLVLGLIPATAGTVEFDGKPVTAQRNHAWRAARRHMQMVYQDPRSAPVHPSPDFRGVDAGCQAVNSQFRPYHPQRRTAQSG